MKRINYIRNEKHFTLSYMDDHFVNQIFEFIFFHAMSNINRWHISNYHSHQNPHIQKVKMVDIGAISAYGGLSMCFKAIIHMPK